MGGWACRSVGETIQVNGVVHVRLMVWTVEVGSIPAAEKLVSKKGLHCWDICGSTYAGKWCVTKIPAGQGLVGKSRISGPRFRSVVKQL